MLTKTKPIAVVTIQATGWCFVRTIALIFSVIVLYECEPSSTRGGV